MAKQTMEIKLYMSELMYNVQQEAHLVGESMRTDENGEQAALVQEVTDEKKDIVLRSFGESYARLRNELSEYLVESNRYGDNLLIPEERAKIKHQLIFGYKGQPPAVDETKKEDNTLFLMVRVPMNFNLAVRDDVANAMHSYMVNSALADWFGITASGQSTQYAQKAQEDMMELRSAMNKRIRPARVHAPEQTSPRQNELRYE